MHGEGSSGRSLVDALSISGNYPTTVAQTCVSSSAWNDRHH